MTGSLQLTAAFNELGLDRATPVIVHASLSAFGLVDGGALAVVQALASAFERLMMPVFTYKTMLVPQIGPPDNGITYGTGQDKNRMAEFFHPAMPADRLMGAIPEALRRFPAAQRSSHPILSFAGLNAGIFLDSQTLEEPLQPINRLAEAGGWVLLLGVNHTVNTSIHCAERLAGRRQFIRWALTPDGVVECPRFPGCSDGFDQIALQLTGVARSVKAGQALVQAIALQEVFAAVYRCLDQDRLALLCERSYCERCHAVRSGLGNREIRPESGAATHLAADPDLPTVAFHDGFSNRQA